MYMYICIYTYINTTVIVEPSVEDLDNKFKKNSLELNKKKIKSVPKR